MISKTRAALAVALTLPLLNACGLDDANQGKVRILNATTEYATMDLYDVDSKNDSNLLLSGTPSNTASGYANLEQGSYTFNLVGAGGSSTAGSATGSVNSGDHYLVIASLTGGALQTQFLSEEETAPTSGNAKLRLYNAGASEAGAVDVYVTSHDCNALQDTDTALATAVSGLQTTFNQILAQSSGTTWNICVTANGDKTSLRLAANQVKFTDQQITTLVMTHTSGGTLLNGMLVDQQGGLQVFANTLARVRVVADAASAATVAASSAGIAFPTAVSPAVGAYQAVPSGAVATALAIGGVALADPGLNFTAGADYTLFVAGTAAAPTVTLFTDSNNASISTSLPVKMRLVNGVNGLDSPASLTSDGTVVADSVAFGAASAYTNVASSDNAADLETFSGSLSLWSATSQTLTSGSVYTVFLLGDYTPAAVPPATPAHGVLRQDRAPSGITAPASSATTGS